MTSSQMTSLEVGLLVLVVFSVFVGIGLVAIAAGFSRRLRVTGNKTLDQASFWGLLFFGALLKLQKGSRSSSGSY
jgi:hypothetical protein